MTTTADMMTFPNTVEEYMEQYKITDTEQIYTNGAELVPIFRMKQWFDHKPEQRWIPCSERLPDEGNEVLVCYDYKGHRSVLIGTLYSDGKFYGYDDEYLTSEGRKYRKVVAWMPLPEPYRGEKNENR